MRNDTDKDFWFFCRLNFLRAINLSSSFLFSDEIITLIPLIVCQNYQLTAIWCCRLFFWWFLPPLWKRWAQMSRNHFINFIYFVVSASCAEPDQICIANSDNSAFILDSDESVENPLILWKVHSKWRSSCCHCMSIIHIFYVARVSRRDPWLLICCSKLTSLWPSWLGRSVTSDRCSLGIWFG